MTSVDIFFWRFSVGEKVFILRLLNASAVCRLLAPLKRLCSKQCAPRSDCFTRSSLIRVHAVCLYAKISHRRKHLYEGDRFSR